MVVLVRKWSLYMYMYMYDIEHSKRYGKSGKRKIRKRSSEILVVKMEFFSEKPHSEILVREKIVRPPKLGARSPPLLSITIHSLV